MYIKCEQHYLEFTVEENFPFGKLKDFLRMPCLLLLYKEIKNFVAKLGNKTPHFTELVKQASAESF